MITTPFVSPRAAAAGRRLVNNLLYDAVRLNWPVGEPPCRVGNLTFALVAGADGPAVEVSLPGGQPVKLTGLESGGEAQVMYAAFAQYGDTTLQDAAALFHAAKLSSPGYLAYEARIDDFLACQKPEGASL